MSGYLQQLVRTAMGTDLSVHPLVKPLFSRPASLHEPALSSRGDNFKFVSTSRLAENVSRKAAEQPNLGEPQINGTAQRLLQPGTTVTVTNFQPLLTANGPPLILQAITPSAEPGLRTLQRSKEQTQGEESRGLVANTPVYAPLLNTVPSRSRSETIETELPAHCGAKMSQQKPRQWSSPAAARDPDEIQIHIGRIEVTAVPPPAATSTPKRAAKGPSLQEYLGRGDRRGS